MDEKKKRPRMEMPKPHAAEHGKVAGSRTASADTLRCLTSALLAFLLGSCALPFGTYPLGLALLCASTEKTVYMALGLLAAAFTVELPWALPLFVTLGTLALRVLARIFIDLPQKIGGDGRRGELLEHLRGRLFCEGLYLRMACVCVSCFSMSLYAIIKGGFRYYDLFGALFSIVVAPLAVFLLAGLFEGEYDRLFDSRTADTLSALSRIAITVAVSYALADTTLYGISLSLVFSFVATLWLCQKKGLAVALAAGLLSGAVLQLSFAPVLAAAALAAYCVLDLSPVMAASVACLAGTLCGMLLTKNSYMSQVFLPLLLGTALFCTAQKLVGERARAAEKYEKAAPPPPRDTTDLQMADSLLELASVFSSMSERQKKPSAADLRLLCDECFEALCPSCTAKSACWETRRLAMMEAVNALSQTLLEDGLISADTFPPDIADHCLYLPRLAEDINSRVSALTRHTICSEKAEIFSLNYTLAATLLHETAEARDSAAFFDEAASAAVKARLLELGYAADVSVTGKRQKNVRLHHLTPAPEPSRMGYLTGQLEKALGCRLSPLCDNGHGWLCAVQKDSLRVGKGSSFCAKEAICGDVVSLFRDEERGLFFALLNDGMGCGKEAALTAQLGSLFLRKLLPSGVRAETALQMLHQFLRLGRNHGSTESCTTVDLLAIDTVTGKAVFYKSGAAPTYVKRGKNIFYLDAKTTPLGILKESDTKQIELDIKAGDKIVMVSDGICDGAEQCLWLLDYLDTTKEEDPSVMAEHIIARASALGRRDDLSAIVLAIDKET